jgi:DNA modification methylase
MSAGHTKKKTVANGVIDARRVEHISTTALKPQAANARTHSRAQIRQIARSIQRFGFNNPILVDQHNNIIAGHGRVEAAKLLGHKTVPTLKVDHISEGEKRAYIIADNKLAEKAGWDRDILAIEFQELIDLGFDVELTGFDVPEIEMILDAADLPSGDGVSEQIPDLVPDRMITKPGDLWKLGDHRLFCGDARFRESFRTLMNGETARLVFVDPPYNVRIQGHVSGNGRVKHREFAQASGEKTSPQFARFLEETLGLLAEHAADGSIHFVCSDWRHLDEMLGAGRRVYRELKNMVVWNKSNAAMGSFYRSQHELIFVWKHGRAKHINNVELGRHGRNRSNVWTYAGANAFGAERLAELAMHPTVKPVALVADAIRDCSRRRDIVLDSFGGSGTTLIASELTQRRGRLIELDPVYCDQTIRRWQKLTGQKATHAASGKAFDVVDKSMNRGKSS